MLAVALGRISLGPGFLASAFISALASALAAPVSLLPSPDAVFGTPAREIGRGFGTGTLSFAQASPQTAARLTARQAVNDIDTAVDRNAAERAKRGTAFLRGAGVQSLSALVYRKGEQILNIP
jgi:hypothetical protein